MRQLSFRALITLAPAPPGSGAPDATERTYRSHTRALVVLARPVRAHDGQARYFPTEVWWDGGAPLRPGDNALVTIRVVDDQAADFLDAGQPFTLWSGGQVGHGVIMRRVLPGGER